MYKLLIADDERIEREALRFIITRATTSIERIVEAVNGTDAVEVAERERPDIVFLDIKMPGINGLDAAREIKARLPDAQVIFLTAFDSFDYAHEAIRIGVKDFIVKPATDERVMEVIRRARSALDELNARAGRNPDDDRKRRRMLELLEHELITDLMRGELEPEQLASYRDVFELDLIAGFPAQVTLNYDSYPMSVDADAQRSVLRKRVLATLRATTADSGERLLGSAQHRDILLLLCADESERVRRDLERRLTDAVSIVRRELSIQVAVGVGRHASNAARFAQGFAEASEAVQATAAEQPVIWYEPSIPTGDTDPTRTVSSARGEPGAHTVSSDRDEPLPHDAPPNHSSMGTQPATGAGESPAGEGAHAAVRRIQQHIQRNYRETLSLEEAARIVRLSPFYFSKVFKQVAGTNFVDYINRVRIERACELLNDGRFSVKEIADRVGYTDANYFARMFKRIRNETPSRYRHRMRTFLS